MHLAVDVCQAALNAVVVIRQVGVIDSEEVQQRGVEVVPGHWVLGRLPTDIVCASIGDASADTTTTTTPPENP